MQKILRKPIDYLDEFLDVITGYRLVLYFLIILVGLASIFGFAGRLPYTGTDILISAVWLSAVCWGTNFGLSKFLGIYKNRESDLITALILCLILSPATTPREFLILGSAGLVAMVSKFILTIGKRHILNPAALGAYSVGLIFDTYPSWWVGTLALTPALFIGGMFILRKMKRFIMVALFIAIYLSVLTYNFVSADSSSSLVHVLWIGLSGTPLLFFGYVMLTEPLTSPRQIQKYIPYAIVVGILYSVTQLHIAPEEALLIGNILAFVLAPERRLNVNLASKHKEADGIYSFHFTQPKKIKYQAGQYLEWTVPATGSDTRGNRRYLTLASSPTEPELSFAIKIPEGPVSSFKKSVAKLNKSDHMLAGSLAGSFTLPKDQNKKLCFIAGGIGVTPYRSMVKYLSDSNQPRDIRMFYSANLASQLAYTKLFESAKKLGVKTTYAATKDSSKTSGVHSGVIDKRLIAANAPDFKDRLFYISGPNSFVKYISSELHDMGVKSSQIKSDYFPGYG